MSTINSSAFLGMRIYSLFFIGGVALALWGWRDPLYAGGSPRARNPDVAAIDAYIAAQMRALGIPGLALGIVQGDQITYLKGVGVADPSGRPVRAQTPFRLASVSKPLTALAVLQLVEQGQIDLDAPVQRYLPWFSVTDPAASQAISVRHLLYHTSGLPRSALNDQYFNGDLSADALERNVRRLAAVAPNRPVGTTFEYADANYSVLGMVVQNVAGKSYESYIQQRIFGLLGMRQSFTAQAEAQQRGLATGYRQWFGRPVPSVLPDDRANIPSGSLIASAEDITHLLIALLNQGRYINSTLLSPAGIAAMQQPRVPIGTSGLQSAMGLDVGALQGIPITAKTGGTANYNARILLIREQHLGVVVLANTFDIGRGDAFDSIADGVALLLLGRQPPAPTSTFIGGNAPIKSGLLVIIMGELIQSLRGIRRMRRGQAVFATNPRRWLTREVGRPLVAGVAVVGLVLGLLPKLMNTSMRFLWYFAPDLFWLTFAAATIPLAEGVVRATLARLAHDQARRPQPALPSIAGDAGATNREQTR